MSVSDSRVLQGEKKPQAGDGGCQDSGLRGGVAHRCLPGILSPVDPGSNGQEEDFQLC